MLDVGLLITGKIRRVDAHDSDQQMLGLRKCGCRLHSLLLRSGESPWKDNLQQQNPETVTIATEMARLTS